MFSMWMIKKCLTITGTFLMMLPVGLPWYWGNMAIYARSYIATYGATVEGLQTPWIISFYFLFNALGLFIAGCLSKYAGKRGTLSLGIGLFLGGVFSTYFTLKISLMMVNLTLGFVAGIGGGIVNGMALQYAVGWARSDLGFVTSFVQSGFNAGPVIINPFVTYLVNPNNLSPNLQMGPNNLFSQRDVVDRVPRLFLSFGILCSVLQIVGLFFVRDCTEKKKEEEIALNSGNSGSVPQSYTSPKPNGVHPTHQDTERQSELPTQQNNTEVSETPTPENGVADKNVFKDLKPLEIIRTKSFFTLSFTLMMFDNSMLVLANYYKEYGAEWIKDDHFLTMLAMVLTLSTMVAFPVWGAMTDRVGVKCVLIYMFSISTLLTISMYFTPRISRWAYLVNIFLSGFFLPPIFSVLIIATCKLFGKTYYSSNLGVVACLSFMVNFVNPMIFAKILSCGWFYTFFYGGCLTTAALIVTAISLPRI